jgi:hypothetical protein
VTLPSFTNAEAAGIVEIKLALAGAEIDSKARAAMPHIVFFMVFPSALNVPRFHASVKVYRING